MAQDFIKILFEKVGTTFFNDLEESLSICVVDQTIVEDSATKVGQKFATLRQLSHKCTIFFPFYQFLQMFQ